MLVFDLQCAKGHSFEGWFESLQDLESQIERKQVKCPVCNSARIKKLPSSFAIGKRGPQPDDEQSARLLHKALHHYLRDNFDDVGTNFATEALKIHYGVNEARNIRGVSTPQEEEVLKKEGVEFFKFGAPAPKDVGEDQD